MTLAAGRISPRSIEAVRERADIVELVQARTGAARRVGGQFMARCPFHDERTASLSLHPGTKLFHCFGCGKSGSVFDLVMELEGLSFPEAVEQLADRYGIELEREDVGPAERQAIARQRRTQALLEDAAAFYERYLAASPEAEPGRAYLAERGVAAESVARFRLGFAPTAWERVADAARAKGYDDEELYEAGLASRGPRGPIDRFRGRLIFPLQDARGQVRGFGARVLPGGEGPKYLNSPESAVFHKGRLLYGLHLARERIARGGRAIVVEGYTDVIALHAAGSTEAVAAMGTSLTADQLRELARLASELVLCFDADAAGQEAAVRGMRLAEAQRLRVRVVPLPRGQDPADLLGDGGAAFDAAIAAARSVLEFRIDRLLARTDVDGKDVVYAAARSLLAEAPVGPERDEQLRRVAGALDLRGATAAALAPGRPRPFGQERPPPRLARDRRAEAERAYLAACLAAPRAGLRSLDAGGEALLRRQEHVALLGWVRETAAGSAPAPPEGREGAAAAIISLADSYAADGTEDADPPRRIATLQLGLEIEELESRIAALKDKQGTDEYSPEAVSGLNAELARLRTRLRAGP